MTTINIIPQVSETYNVGAILYNDWGYEQTNIDFYCIIVRKGEWLTLVPMTKAVTPDGGFQSMTNKVLPGQMKFDAKPIRKKLKSFKGEERGFSFESYSGGGWCSLWNGKPKFESHYA
ncbi:MAG: hypothetical protein WKF91_15545 [Segetibacter sp.]